MRGGIEMYTFKAENEYGDILELTHSPDYTVTGIEGLDPPKAAVNTSLFVITFVGFVSIMENGTPSAPVAKGK